MDFTQTDMVAHHVRTGNGGGMGMKVSDYYTIPMTALEHSRLHAGVEKEYYKSKHLNTDEQIVANLLVFIATGGFDCRILREKLIQVIEEIR